MILTRNSRIEFIPFPHSYILDGEKVLTGLTTILKKHGLSANYSAVDDATLEHAADLGTQAHEAIEAYCNGGAVPQIPLIKSFAKLGLNICATEYLVSDNETVASAIDLINEVDDHTVDLLDMKRTSSVHKDALRWQLGAYRYLFELANPGIKVRNCYCLPIKKGNKDDILKDTCGKLVEIDPMDSEKVIALLDAEKNGVIYTDESIDFNALEIANIVEGFMSIGFGDSLRLLAEYQEKAKEVEESIANAKEAIYNEMLAKGVEKVEVDGVSITLKKPYETTRVDSKALQTDFPEVYERVAKTSTCKGNITIKIK